MYNSRKIIDKINGDRDELKVKPILEEYFKTTLTKLGEYNTFDFQDSNGRFYEVKCRTNAYNKYPTTMIGANKIDKANRFTKPTYFIFKFTDGIYYLEYTKEKLDLLNLDVGGRKDRGVLEYKNYYYIPIELLIKIEIPPERCQ